MQGKSDGHGALGLLSLLMLHVGIAVAVAHNHIYSYEIATEYHLYVLLSAVMVVIVAVHHFIDEPRVKISLGHLFEKNLFFVMVLSHFSCAQITLNFQC